MATIGRRPARAPLSSSDIPDGVVHDVDLHSTLDLGNKTVTLGSPTVTGTITTTNHGTSAQWNTAYGWGDHSAAGYQAASSALTTATTFSGDVSGTYNSIVVADNSHNHEWANITNLPDPVITLAGDVSGSATMTNLGSATITVTVADDSHTHDTRYYTETEIDNYFSGSSAITGYNKTNWDTAYGWGDHSVEGYLTGNQTITLTGDVSGSGTTSIAVTIADDSHNHVISNVDGLQTALDAKQDASNALTTSNYTSTLNAVYANRTGDTFTGNVLFSDSGTTKRGVRGIVGTNDYWFFGGGATASNAGYVEIAAGDDGSTAGSYEPIYVRQYSGDPLTGTVQRTLTLLDNNGNTSVPGQLLMSAVHSKSKIALFGTNGAELIGTSTSTLELSGASINFNGADGTGTPNLKMAGNTIVDSQRRFFAYGYGTSTTPVLSITNTATTTFNHASQAFAASMTSGQFHGHFFGKEGSTKNAGAIGYVWSSAGSNDNYVSIGHWGADHLLRVYGDGTVNINSGRLDMGGTTVIDTSRNATLGTISSGAITVTSQTGWDHVAPGVESGYTSAHGMAARFDAGNTRWYLVPRIDGSFSFNRELYFDHSAAEWTIEGPVNLGSLSSGSITTTGNLINNSDGGIFLKSNTSEANNWLFKEYAANWGIFYLNKGSQAGATVGGYTTVGAEYFFTSSVSGYGPAMPSTWTGYQSGSYLNIMLSPYQGYIYAGDKIEAKNGFILNNTTVIDSSRNLTSIGTISSGAITSSGNIYTTAGKLRATGSGSDYALELSSTYSYASVFYHNIANASQSFNDAIFLQNTNSGNSNYVSIGMSTNGTDGQHHRAQLRAVKDSGGNYHGKFQIYTRGSGGSNNLGLEINGSSNVSIPNGTLTSSGSIYTDESLVVNSNISGNHYLYLKKPASGDGHLLFQEGSGLRWQNIATSGSAAINWYSYTASATTFQLQDSGGANLIVGDYKINGTTVIDSSRNLQNIGVLNVSSINSTGKAEFRQLQIDRAETNGAIWFQEGNLDTNHVLWNNHYGGPTTRGTAGSGGFDGMKWNTFAGLQIRGGSSGNYDIARFSTDGSGSGNGHYVRLYQANAERFRTTSAGISVTGAAQASNGFYAPASGTGSNNHSTGIKQTTNEGWTAIFADYEPFHGYGIYHDNPNDTFYVTAESSTNNIGSFTVTNHNGATRTAYVKSKFTQGSGAIHAGGGFFVGNTNFIDTSRNLVNISGITASKAGDTPFFFKKTSSASNTNVAMLVENQYGNHSWGMVGELRVAGDAGSDDPSLLFSQGYNSNTYSIGFGYNDHTNFRIKRDHGHRNSGWGTSLMTMDRSGNVTFAGNVTAYSDERLKENIQTIPNALEAVKQLRGVTYNWKETGEQGLGVIAQEVEAVEITKCLVSETPEDGAAEFRQKNVAYGNMVGLLIEAVKEQQTQIEALQAKIEELENGNH